MVKRIHFTGDEVEKLIRDKAAKLLGEEADDLTLRIGFDVPGRAIHQAVVTIGYEQDAAAIGT